MVYSFGIEDTETAVVTTLVVPNADATAGSIQTSPEVNAEALRVIVDTPLMYLGQAHSHPGPHVKHSCFDDEQTFARFDGAISVVVPWFGRYGLHLAECGVHRHRDGRFQEIRNIDRHLRIVPGSRDLQRQPMNDDSRIINRRWSTAEAFYAERDHRTQLEVEDFTRTCTPQWKYTLVRLPQAVAPHSALPYWPQTLPRVQQDTLRSLYLIYR